MTPVDWTTPPTLRGAHVALEPLSPAHVAGLRDAVEDGRLYDLWYTNVPEAKDVEAYVAGALDKQAGGTQLGFAVLDDAQGEGLGRAVWNVMREANPRLFWRSRNGNPVNAFYTAECDGTIKQPRWQVFWYGLDSLDEIGACVEHCARRPATLED